MQQTYEETRVKKDDAWAKYMKEGADVQLVTWNGKVISVDPPNTVELAIAETEPGVKGNTVSGGTKPAVLETGAVVMVRERGGGARRCARARRARRVHPVAPPLPPLQQVPLFVGAGEVIKVDTRTDEYLGRQQK